MLHLFNKKITISYYLEGSRNDLGEPSRTLTVRATSVPCRLEWRSERLSYEIPIFLRPQTKQGILNITTHILLVKANQTINDNDIVTDADSETYLVATVRTLKTHKEVLLQKEVT